MIITRNLYFFLMINSEQTTVQFYLGDDVSWQLITDLQFVNNIYLLKEV